ncbi:MAG: hypothetical protein JWM16_6385 [Verrucomicrobiales bacterium]|nr:hypothetical protein [Verrucomicrobiales bacterium]
MNQRQPRQEDPAFLAYVRTLPCLVCARPGPNDPAHIRSAAPLYGKRYTGKGEKPDDKWVLPLCRPHHNAQHRESELGWWAGMGIPDPFAVAEALYAARPGASKPRVERPRKPKLRTRLPPEQRRPIVGRTEIQSPGFDKSRSRKMNGKVVAR